ncbi:unnamed protein product, partial [Scytosiphon promiscuus]
MGNGNTRPPKEPKELEAEGDELVGGSRGKFAPSVQRKSGHRQAPTGHTTTAITALYSGSFGAYTGKDCATPSSNPSPPAAPSSSATLPQSANSSSNPAVTLPTRIVFSASLERSLISAGRRRPTVLSSSSSWTSGRLTRDDTQGSNSASASSFGSYSLGRGQRVKKDGGEGSKRTADNVVEPAAPTRTTTGYMQHSKRQDNSAASKIAAFEREEVDLREAVSESRRWKGLRGSSPTSPSGKDCCGGAGDAATSIEAIIHTARSKSPDEAPRCKEDRQPGAVIVADGRGNGQVEGSQAPRRALYSEQSMIPRSGIPRGGRSRSGSLPKVKCWEASAPAKEGGGADDVEGEYRRPRGRPVRSRSHAGATSPRAARGKREISTISIAEGQSACNRMEAGTAGVAATARDAGREASRRASSEELSIRRQRRLGGGEGGRTSFGRRSGRGGSGASGGSSSYSASTARDGGPQSASASPPPLEHLPVASSAEDATCLDFEESLSVSSANSVGIVQEQLSVCSSLPPMGGAAATAATDLIFEESSFEDSGASLSQTSSTDRNGADGDEASGHGAGSPSSCSTVAHHVVGAVYFLPTRIARISRSVGRGLSNLMTRIHEKEEYGERNTGPPQDPLLHSMSSRPGAGEIFRIQELSDCDNDGLGAVLSTSRPVASSSTFPATVTPIAAAAPVTMNVGHQRAAMELRNLTLEREVEQLKTHLRNMGGDDVTTSDRHLHSVRRPRSRQQNRAGDQTLPPRYGASSSLTETPAPIPRRGSGGGARDRDKSGGSTRRSGGGDGSSTSARGKGGGGPARRSWDNHREGGERGRIVPHNRGRQRPTGSLRLTRPRSPASSPSATLLTEASPPPHATGERSEARGPSVDKGGVGNAAGGTRASNGCVFPRGPRSTAVELKTKLPILQTLHAAGNFLPQHRGSVACPVCAACDFTGRLSRRRLSDATFRRGRLPLFDAPAPGDELSRTVAEKRALPRLRAEGGEQRRGPRAKTRAARAPMNLGGVVSGIKHTLLTRRRSTGDRGAPVPLPISSQTTPRSGFASSQEGGGDDRKDAKSSDRIAPVGEGDTASAFNAAATTATPAPNSKREGEKNRGSRRTTRAGETVCSSRSSSEPPKVGLGEQGAKGEETSQIPTKAEQRTEGTDGNAVVSFTPPDTETSGEIIVAAAVTGPPTEASASTASAKVEAGIGAVPTTVGGEEIGGIAADKSPLYGRWPATLDARWAEVEFMLCHEVNCEESLQYTIQATEAGLVFMEKLEEKARELGVLKGQLSRWLLPFNADTSVERQQAATPRRFQESLLALSANHGTATGGGPLTEAEAAYLTAGARRVRQLVRVKIADDNDLNTAKEALATMAGFFTSISEEAAKRGGNATAFSVLQERRAVSPLTRPPPLPSIPRPSSAMTQPTTERAKGLHGGSSPKTEIDDAQANDSRAQGTSLAPTSTAEPASSSEAAAPSKGQEGGQS